MKSRILFLPLALSVCLFDQAQAAVDHSTLIVMPARYRVVGYVSDAARLTGSDIVAYQVVTRAPEIDVEKLARSNEAVYTPSKTPPEIVLHVWSGGKWVELSMDKYREGLFLARIPKRIVLLGGKDGAPEALVDASSWAPDVRAINTLDLAPLTTQLDALFHFSPDQLKWLARRHDLQLVDTTVERRKYGRYGGKPWNNPLRSFMKRNDAGTLPSAKKPAAVKASGEKSQIGMPPEVESKAPQAKIKTEATLPADK